MNSNQSIKSLISLTCKNLV